MTQHEKMYLMTCAPSEDLNSSRMRSLISICWALAESRFLCCFGRTAGTLTRLCGFVYSSESSLFDSKQNISSHCGGNQSTHGTGGSIVSECRLGNGPERRRKTVSFNP